MFGSKVGNPGGDGAIGAPYYKGLYVSKCFVRGLTG
jgi:hypothetical protein